MENLPTQPAHPYTNLLIKWLDNIGEASISGRAGLALMAMIQLLLTVDPEKRDAEWEELYKSFQRTWKARNKVRDADPILLKQKLDSFDIFNVHDYWNLWSRLWGVFWKIGYFYMNTFMGVFPAQKLEKEKETPEEAPFPERLPEDLR